MTEQSSRRQDRLTCSELANAFAVLAGYEMPALDEAMACLLLSQTTHGLIMLQLRAHVTDPFGYNSSTGSFDKPRKRSNQRRTPRVLYHCALGL